MSRLYVDRISPYQSASVTVDGLDTSTLTTKTTFNSYTSSNDSKVTSLINATGSYAGTGIVNTFTAGPQVVSGSDGYLRQQLEMPKDGAFVQKIFWETNNQNLSYGGNGDYNVTQEYLLNYEGGGRWYEETWYFEAFQNAITLDYGSEASMNGGGFRWAAYASGSSLGRSADVKVQDDYDGGCSVIMDAQEINIGTSGTAATRARDGINIGNSNMESNITFGQVINLPQFDPLPSGILGDLAVSGSALYFNNGTSWNAIS